eukprot:3384517-Rhodomonas_salina.2
MPSTPNYSDTSGPSDYQLVKASPKYTLASPVKAARSHSTASDPSSMKFLQEGFSDSFKILDNFFQMSQNEEVAPQPLSVHAPEEEVAPWFNDPERSDASRKSVDPVEENISERYKNIMKWKKRLSQAKAKIAEARAERDMAEKMLQMLALEDQMSANSQGEQNPVGGHVHFDDHPSSSKHQIMPPPAVPSKNRSAVVAPQSARPSASPKQDLKGERLSPKHAQNPQ